MGEPAATCSFEELIQSKLFTFYIGKEKKAFVVHSKAIAATSWHFHALVSNGMAQSQEGSVEYPDMDPDDFARFVEYAYRYDYTAPSWTPDQRTAESDNTNGTAHNGEDAPPPPPPEAAAEVEVEIPDEWAVPEPVVPEPEDPNRYWGLSKSQAKKLKMAEMRAKPAQATHVLRQSFDERSYLTPHEPRMTMLIDQMPKSNCKPEQDFTPVFLAHARLYTFACMRLIDPLKRLALHKLYQTLRSFKLFDRRVGDVVELGRYAYEHGEDRKPDGTVEDLRKLVVEYIACEVSTIGKHEAFAQLLQEGGEFVVDFWRIIVKENLGL